MDVFRSLQDLAKYPNHKLVRTAKQTSSYIKRKNATSLATTKRMRKGDSFPVVRDNMTRHEVFEMQNSKVYAKSPEFLPALRLIIFGKKPVTTNLR